MSTLYEELIDQIKSLSPDNPDQEINKKYHGNTHHFYGLRVPVKRAIVKTFLKKHHEISPQEFSELITRLIKGDSFDEKTLAGHLVETAVKLRKTLNPESLDIWLNYLEGWAEIDCLCQSSFTAEEILNNWPKWSGLLEKFNSDKHIQKRRASLVLLIKSVGNSQDTRLSDLAFKNITNLKHEKDILITKAISWLLRTLIRYHKQQVAEYITANQETLPKIAVRETKIKLTYGIKNYKL